MTGRAGRFGLDTSGDSILIVKNSEYNQSRKLLETAKKNPEAVKSCLMNVDMGLRKLFLDCIGTKLAQNEDELKKFLECSLLYTQKLNEFKAENPDLPSEEVNQKTWDYIVKLGQSILQFLIQNEVIMQIERNPAEEEKKETAQPMFKFKPTQLGRAVMNTGVMLEEGLLIYLDLKQASYGLTITHELHLLYLMTPAHCPEIWIDWNIFQQIFKRFSP